MPTLVQWGSLRRLLQLEAAHFNTERDMFALPSLCRRAEPKAILWSEVGLLRVNKLHESDREEGSYRPLCPTTTILYAAHFALRL